MPDHAADQLARDLQALADKAVAASQASEPPPDPDTRPTPGWSRPLLGALGAFLVAALMVGVIVTVARHQSSKHEGVQTTAPAASAPIPMPPAVLDQVARQVAAMGTATGPVRYTHGLRSVAGPVLDDGDETFGPLTDVAVWAIVVPGSFVDTKAYIPSRASDPRGAYLELAISDSTQPTVLDLGLSGRAPNLAEIGRVGRAELPTGTATGQAFPCVGVARRADIVRTEVDLEVQAIDGHTVIRHETVPGAERYDFTLPAGQYRIGVVPGDPVAVTVLPAQETVVPQEACK